MQQVFDLIDRIYERLDYPWYLHPLLLLWVVLPVALPLLVWGVLEFIWWSLQ
jgi:hypothetical protein